MSTAENAGMSRTYPRAREMGEVKGTRQKFAECTGKLFLKRVLENRDKMERKKNGPGKTGEN